MGELSRDEEREGDAQHRAFLLDCALGAAIGEPDYTRAQYAKIMTAKQALAERLLSAAPDVGFRDENGGTLLMSVVHSYLPDPWRRRAAERLLADGCDPSARDNGGRTAIELADPQQDAAIITLLRQRATSPRARDVVKPH